MSDKTNKFMKWVEEGFLEEAGVILKPAWKDADLLQKEGRGRSKEKGEERQRHRPMSEHSTVRQWAEKQGSGQEQVWTQKSRLFTHSAKHLSCCISVSWRDTGVLEQFLSVCGLLPRVDTGPHSSWPPRVQHRARHLQTSTNP